MWSDTTLVKCTYTSLPKPLHKELKKYLEDLLKKRMNSEIMVPNTHQPQSVCDCMGVHCFSVLDVSLWFSGGEQQITNILYYTFDSSRVPVQYGGVPMKYLSHMWMSTANNLSTICVILCITIKHVVWSLLQTRARCLKKFWTFN